MRVLFVFLLSSLVMFGCQEEEAPIADPCESVICDYGDCTDGVCELWRDDMTGFYNVVTSCVGGSSTQETIAVSQLSQDNRIDFDGDFYGVITSSTEFNVPIQTYYDPEANVDLTVSGSGTVTGGTLSMTLSVTGNGQGTTCTIVGNRQ